MKLKPLVIVVAVLAVASIVTAFLKQGSRNPTGDPRVGEPIVTRETLEKVAAVQIKAAGNEINLVNTAPTGSAWVVREYYDLPVDFSKLSTFINNLRDAEVIRFASANPERIERMDFDGTRVELRDAEGQALWSAEFGRTVSSGGRFIKFGDETKAYLTSLSAWIDSTTKNWADSTLVPAKTENVRGLDVSLPDGTTLQLKRENATASWMAEGLATGETLKETEVSSLLSRLTTLRFTETTEPDAPDAVAARENAREFKLHMADGKTYTIRIGRRPAPPAPETPPAPPAGEGEAAETPPTPPTPQPGPVFVFVQSSHPDDPVNSLMQRRAYQVTEWTFTSLPADRSALVQAAPAETPTTESPAPTGTESSQPATTPAAPTTP